MYTAEYFLMGLGALVILLMLVALVSLAGQPEADNKLVWAMIILVFPFLGALLYLLLGRRRPGRAKS